MKIEAASRLIASSNHEAAMKELLKYLGVPKATVVDTDPDLISFRFKTSDSDAIRAKLVKRFGDTDDRRGPKSQFAVWKKGNDQINSELPRGEGIAKMTYWPGTL